MKKDPKQRNIPLGLAKVTIPRNAQALERDHLFKKLDQLRDQQTIWITSPAGSGKTTLLSKYLEIRDISCLWYQVDMGDDDPATFFHYLGLAALSRAPHTKKTFPALTPEYLSGLTIFTQKFFEELCSFLLSSSRKKTGKSHEQPKGTAIVFDNCQDVSPDSSIFTIILNGLARIPSGINVFLISRTAPPPVYARMQANGQMGLLGWNDLRLSYEETEHIIRMRCSQDTSQEAIAHIHKVTEGWAAGLTLMLDMIKREGSDILVPEGLTPEEIMYYFGSELFDRLDDPTRNFLMKSAFLPKMTVEMAQKLTGIEESGRILSVLYRNNYFIHKHVHQEVSSYEYHTLFREFLLKMARELLSREALDAVISSASSILEANGQVEAAMGLLKQISDKKTMASIIINNAPGLIAQGRFRTLKEWLAPIPDAEMVDQPWLVYWKGASLLPVDPYSAKEIFEQAFRGFESSGEKNGQLFSLCGIIESIQFSFGDLRQYDPWIPVIEELFPLSEDIQTRELEARLLDGMVTAFVLRKPEHPWLPIWVNRAAALLEQPLPLTMKARLLHAVLFYYILQFDVEKMDLVHDQLGAIIHSKDLPIESHLLIHLMEANYHVIKANHAECLNAVSEGMSIARESGVHIMDHFFQCHAATSFLNENDPQKAREFLDEITGQYDSLSPWQRKAYHQVKAREALILKDGHQAYLHASKTLELIELLGLKVHVPIGCYLLSQALHMLGRHDEEQELIGLSLEENRLVDKRTHDFHTMLLNATCAFDRGNDETGLACLKKAFALGKETGQLGAYGDLPAETSRLCARALEEGIEPEYAKWLITKRRLIPENPPVTVDQWPWAVKIYTLGGFRIERDDAILSFARKAQKMPLEMLKLLVASNGDISEISMADLLWPDADGDLALQTCATTCHRLRKLLGHPEALTIRDGHMALDPRWCWVDAWACERLLDSAQTFKRNDNQERVCRLTEQALVLYRGRFLEGESENSCTVSTAERLRSKFLQGVRYLAQCHENAGEWEKATQYYARCLDIDDCVEEIYQHLMRCHHHLGRHDEALGVYRRCDHTFKTVFGIKPSAATEHLRDAILHERK